MAVLQLPKERSTKDGRRWYFYDKIKVDGKTKPYMSRSYMTRNEALKAERDFSNFYSSQSQNIMRFFIIVF